MEIVSVADAVATLEYLHRRELLCTSCGDRMAVYENAFKRCCAECKPPHGDFNKAKVPSVVERCIISALQRWLAEHQVDAEPGPA